MNDKCTKYESLFIFQDEESLKKHIEECEDCKKEQEKMDKVSSLLDEVKFYYHAKNRKSKKRYLQAACILGFLLVTSLSIGVFYNNADVLDALSYDNTLSAEDLGFPVDSYGFIMVDE